MVQRQGRFVEGFGTRVSNMRVQAFIKLYESHWSSNWGFRSVPKTVYPKPPRSPNAKPIAGIGMGVSSFRYLAFRFRVEGLGRIVLGLVCGLRFLARSLISKAIHA